MIIQFFPESTRGAHRREQVERPERPGAFTDDYNGYGRDYFDNPDIGVGYGGYDYDGRFADAARRMCDHYGLRPGDAVLEIGCAKGFALVEFCKLGMAVAGIDASPYAVSHAHPDVAETIQVGDAADLPFDDHSFGLVYGKEVLPHIPEENIRDVVRECMRVSSGGLFFEIQCGRTPTELEYMRSWDTTHRLVWTPAQWDALFSELGYGGDMHYEVLVPES